MNKEYIVFGISNKNSEILRRIMDSRGYKRIDKVRDGTLIIYGNTEIKYQYIKYKYNGQVYTATRKTNMPFSLAYDIDGFGKSQFKTINAQLVKKAMRRRDLAEFEHYSVDIVDINARPLAESIIKNIIGLTHYNVTFEHYNSIFDKYGKRLNDSSRLIKMLSMNDEQKFKLIDKLVSTYNFIDDNFWEALALYELYGAKSAGGLSNNVIEYINKWRELFGIDAYTYQSPISHILYPYGSYHQTAEIKQLNKIKSLCDSMGISLIDSHDIDRIINYWTNVKKVVYGDE